MAYLDRLLNDRDRRLRINFDTGHVIRNRSLFQINLREEVFEYWRWVKLEPAADGKRTRETRRSPIRRPSLTSHFSERTTRSSHSW